MSAGPPRCVVLLEKPDDLQPARLAQALARHGKIPLQDAARQARRCWGIMGEELEEGAARALAEALRDAGLGVIVLPSHRLEALPPPVLIAGADWDEEGLRPVTGTGQGEMIPWPQLRLIAVAGLPEIKTVRVRSGQGPGLGRKAVGLGLTMVTGLPMGLGGRRRPAEKVQRSAELVLCLDLYRRPPLERFRIDAQAFDYSCLRDRMLPHALGNFRTVVEVLVQHSPEAMRTRGAELLLGGQPLTAMGYESLADLDRESRWLLTLDALRQP